MPVVSVRVAARAMALIGWAWVVGVAGESTAPAALVVPPDGMRVSSWSVPHEPHSGQRPNHFGDEYPHSEQVWITRVFLAKFI